MFKFVLTLATVASAQLLAPANPGAGGSLDQTGLTTMKQIIVPYLFNILKNLTLPDVESGSITLSDIVLQLPQPNVSQITVTNDHADNAVDLTADGVEAVIEANFEYKSWITVDGHAKINIKKLDLDLALNLSTQTGTPAYDLAPKVDVAKLDIVINPDDIDIELTGGLVAKIAEILIPLLKSTIIPEMVTQIETQVRQTIDVKVNQDLETYGSQITVPFLAGASLDYGQLNGGPTIDANGNFVMALNGTGFDANHIQQSKYTPAKFNPRDPKGLSLQLYLTDFMINTIFEAGFLTGNDLDITQLLKEFLNVTVTTDNLGLFVPELLTKYGSGKAVGLAGKFTQKAATSFFTPSGQTLDGSLMVTITVGNDTAILAEFDGISANLHLTSHDGTVYGSIAKASLGTIVASSFQTTLGITSDHLISELQTRLDGQVALVNKNLTAGIHIPTFLGIKVSAFEINSFQGYVQLGLTVTQEFWIGVRDKYFPELSKEAESAGISIFKDKAYSKVIYDDLKWARESIQSEYKFLWA